MKIFEAGCKIFEGSKEEGEEFISHLQKVLMEIHNEIHCTYFIREGQEWDSYLKDLEVLSPALYKNLLEIKELFGENFLCFVFLYPNLPGISFWVKNGEKKQLGILSCLFWGLTNRFRTREFCIEYDEGEDE